MSLLWLSPQGVLQAFDAGCPHILGRYSGQFVWIYYIGMPNFKFYFFLKLSIFENIYNKKDKQNMYDNTNAVAITAKGLAQYNYGARQVLMALWYLNMSSFIVKTTKFVPFWYLKVYHTPFCVLLTYTILPWCSCMSLMHNG